MFQNAQAQKGYQRSPNVGSKKVSRSMSFVKVLQNQQNFEKNRWIEQVNNWSKSWANRTKTSTRNSTTDSLN
jgi:hypothetical protein